MQYRKTQLLIHTDVLANNMRVVKRVMQNTRCMAVVKADAYGHGAVTAGKLFLRNGADCLAVATPEEGITLRQNGITAPILVLGGLTADGARACVAYNIAVALYDESLLPILQQEAQKRDSVAHAHLKIDTGMSRIGLRTAQELSSMLEKLRSCPAVKCEGAFTHFADAEGDPEFTRLQNAAFLRALAQIRGAGYRPTAHAAASAASLIDPTLRHDMVRPGVVLYGAAVKYLCPEIEPAQTLVTSPVRIETIQAGDTVGYGRTFRAARDSVIMTLPIGYGDGYPRSLSNKAFVLVKGKRAPIVGNVCMDMLMCDITGIEGVTLEDAVVLLGKQGENRITPDELASLAGTIPYEIMLGFHARVPRKEC